MECQGCSWVMHLKCAGVAMPPRIPFVCDACREAAQALQVKDLLLDRRLLTFLVTGDVPTDPIEEHRVRKAAKYLHLDPAG